MSKKDLLVTTKLPTFEVSLKPEYLRLRDDLLVESGFITEINDDDELKLAIDVTGRLKGFNSDVEATRKAVKRPVLDAGEEIDNTAKAVVKKSEPEATRLERLISAYQVEKERKAAAERERLRRQAEEAERQRLAAEAEKQREIEAARQREAEANTEADREAARIEADRLAQEEFERSLNASFDAADEAGGMASLALEVADDSTKGASVRTQYEVEITDIRALYGFESGLYVELTPKLRDLKARINLVNPGVDIFAIPGVKVTETTKVTVRAQKTLKEI